MGVLAVGLVALGPAVFHGDAVLVCAWLGVAAGEAGVVATAWGVRQWRFAPGPRRRSLATLVAVAVALVVAVPELVTSDVPFVAPVLTALLLAVVVVLARVPARLQSDARVR
jgi:hypothetical protein